MLIYEWQVLYHLITNKVRDASSGLLRHSVKFEDMSTLAPCLTTTKQNHQDFPNILMPENFHILIFYSN